MPLPLWGSPLDIWGLEYNVWIMGRTCQGVEVHGLTSLQVFIDVLPTAQRSRRVERVSPRAGEMGQILG